MLDSYPNLRFNLFKWFASHSGRFGWSHLGTSDFVAYMIGDGFFTLAEMQDIFSQKCPSREFINEQIKQSRKKMEKDLERGKNAGEIKVETH